MKEHGEIPETDSQTEENPKKSSYYMDDTDYDTPLTQEQFDMDVAWRFFFREMGKKDLIKILNVCTDSQISPEAQVEFLDTAGRKALGPSALYSRQQDLVISLQEGEKPVEKISIELQTYHDPEFSMRLFAYGFNTAKKSHGHHYTFQKSCTFYLKSGTVEKGHDVFKMDQLQFYVSQGEDRKYQSEKEDTLCVMFPFINLLAMDWETLTSPDYALLQTLFAYRYVMDPDLILTDESVSFYQVIQDMEQFIRSLEDGESRKAHHSMYNHLVTRISELCGRKPDKFEKEMGFMKTTFVDLSKFEETCVEKGIGIGVGLGREEGIGIGREEGIGIGVEKEKLNTIGKMLKSGLAKMDILNILGCSEELYEKAYKLAHS